jgi:5'-deoxynucleotidase YfbR-like HD superfamily hydrolase
VSTSNQLLRSIALARLALAFGRVDRVTFHEDGRQPESDADHTVMLGIIACDLADELGLSYDLGLVAQFSLVHDLVEVYAGDTQTLTIDEAGRDAKARREFAARERISREFGLTSWLACTIHDYDAQLIPEARFVRVVDKILPKLTHLLNNCVAARRLTTAEGFRASHQAQVGKLLLEYPDIANKVHDLLREAMIASEAAFPRPAEELTTKKAAAPADEEK